MPHDKIWNSITTYEKLSQKSNPLNLNLIKSPDLNTVYQKHEQYKSTKSTDNTSNHLIQRKGRGQKRVLFRLRGSKANILWKPCLNHDFSKSTIKKNFWENQGNINTEWVYTIFMNFVNDNNHKRITFFFFS